MDDLPIRRGRTLASAAALLSSLALSAWAGPAPGPVEDSLQRMTTAAGEPLDVARSESTGLVRFLSARPGRGVPVSAATPADRARAFLDAYGQAFGLEDASQYEVRSVSPRDEVGMEHVRVRQLHRGVPVTGGELYVHLKGDRVLAANGKTLAGLDPVDVVPAIAAPEAARAALASLADKFGLEGLEASEPRLEILNRGMLEEAPHPTQLAWFVELRRLDVRELVWVDARSGDVLFHFSQLTDAKSRAIYTANNTSTLPGTLVRSEGGAATGDTDADKAYDYSGHTYDYFYAYHGRDSYDGAGAQIKSSVHYCATSCPYANAFWNGSQMVYGEGYSRADDVDAHELTHAVTEHTAGLFYYMQSGALNESFSDIFGESVDLLNGAGNDTTGVRWQLGEDVPGLGAIRNMMNPNAFSDPARMGDSTYFVCQSPGGDGGGVHTNSGVPNHAFALMVDGGSYNGQTITGIGLNKAGKIQYRALANYLLSASDFLEDYQALNRSCADLLGVAGITSSDCAQVAKALTAVQMNYAWPCTPPIQATVPAFCPSGQAPTSFYMDNLEGSSLSECSGSATPSAWCRNGPTSLLGAYATSGTHSFWGYNRPAAGTMTLTLTLGGTLPAGARFQFNHSFGFEDGGSSSFYDGGVVEYSSNNGTSYADASSLFSAGQGYGGAISSCCSNPLAGRSAFVRESWGYTATQLYLGSLAGSPFRLRWTLGTDSSYDDYGWFLDDLRAYTCVVEAPPRMDYDADRSADLTVYHAATGAWYHRASGSGATTSVIFGGSGYAPLSGDFDGDNKSDETVFHAATGLWFVRQSTTGTTFALAYGDSSYTPVPADYDGDGKTDIAVFHPASGLWFLRYSGSGSTFAVGYGGVGYTPVPADYDGDGKADVAVFHASSGLWFVRYSSSGATFAVGYGGVGYTPVPADYDGDGKADIAVYHAASGLWFVRQSYSASTLGLGYGASGYTPVPADYDGDGKADIAVYHAPTGSWFIRQSHNGLTASYAFGGTGFVPVN